MMEAKVASVCIPNVAMIVYFQNEWQQLPASAPWPIGRRGERSSSRPFFFSWAPCAFPLLLWVPSSSWQYTPVAWTVHTAHHTWSWETNVSLPGKVVFLCRYIRRHQHLMLVMLFYTSIMKRNFQPCTTILPSVTILNLLLQGCTINFDLLLTGIKVFSDAAFKCSKIRGRQSFGWSIHRHTRWSRWYLDSDPSINRYHRFAPLQPKRSRYFLQQEQHIYYSSGIPLSSVYCLPLAKAAAGRSGYRWSPLDHEALTSRLFLHLQWAAAFHLSHIQEAGIA